MTNTSERSAGDSFRGSVLRGVAWHSGTRGLFELSKIVVATVLARLLTPHQYGVAAMVLLAVSFEPVLAGTGLASALVQRPQVSDVDKSTIFWTNAVMGLFVCLAGVAGSGLVAHFYRTPEVRPLFMAISVDFFVASLSSVQTQLFVRDMNFKALEVRSMVAVVVAAATAIVVAFAGGGPWALVSQQLAFSGVSLVLLWRFSSWRPSLQFSGRALKEMRRFGGNVSGSMVMFQLTGNCDNLLIGRFLGASALGFYGLGYNLIFAPVGRIVALVIQVFYPVFSRVQSDQARVAALWLRLLRLTAAVALPISLGLIVLAPDLVPLVFGPRWAPATTVVQILAGVAFLYGVQGINAMVLQAINRTSSLFRYSCVLFAVSLSAFGIGLHWGITGVAGCFAIATLGLQPAFLRLTARAVGLGPMDCWRAVSGVVVAAVASVLMALLTRHIALALHMGTIVRLVASMSAGALTYLPVCLWRAPELAAELPWPRGLRIRGRVSIRRVAGRG